MTLDAQVLRALLRLARRRLPSDEEEIALRSGGTAREVRVVLRRLRAQGLVEIPYPAPARLTLAGLAVAVALLPATRSRRAQPATRPSRAA